jgi:acetyl-CoA carboxylase biotin carboxyl carrier protein
MNQKELRELIEFLIEKDIAEFELERGDVKVRVKRGVAAMVSVPAPQAAPMASAAAGRVELTGAATSAKAAGGQLEEGLHIVKSPIVGTFYESPSPGSPPFAKPGDAVENGQILCIIEAMKLMNEIEADMSGELVKQLVTNGQPVEYGQSLFAIRPR